MCVQNQAGLEKQYQKIKKYTLSQRDSLRNGTLRGFSMFEISTTELMMGDFDASSPKSHGKLRHH